MSNLAARFAVAVVAVPPLLYAIYRDSPHPVWGIVFAASLVAMFEFFTMTIEDKKDRQVSLVFGAAVVATLYWWPQWTVFAFVGGVVGPMFYYLFRFGDMSTVASRVAYSIMGIFYAGVLPTFIVLVKRDFPTDVSGHFVVLILMTAWFADTGGYFAGKAFGNKKLYAEVSPNKTWAGAIGGTLASVAGGVGLKLIFLDAVPWFDIVLLSFMGSVLGQLGDLAESLIKRSVGVKDSGAILPGHGGILDRIDAVILIAPVIYLYARFYPSFL
jgi:phosphatidate cytidylyltransferase